MGDAAAQKNGRNLGVAISYLKEKPRCFKRRFRVACAGEVSTIRNQSGLNLMRDKRGLGDEGFSPGFRHSARNLVCFGTSLLAAATVSRSGSQKRKLILLL